MRKEILIIIAVSFFAFCKKKNETPPTVTPTNNTPINTSLQNGLGSEANNLNGVLQAEKMEIPAFSFVAYESRAAFDAAQKPYSNYFMLGGIFATTGVYAGALKLNNTTLKYDISTANQINRYKDTLSSRNYSAGATWDLTANSSFSSFSVNVSRGFPIISNPNYLPNTISKSAGFTINFGVSNYSNTDSILVLIQGGAGTTSYPYKHLAGSVTSVTYTPAELNNIGNGSGQIIIYALNYSNITVNSKNYLLIMQYDVINPVTINP